MSEAIRCLYCYEEFQRRDLQFRCSGRAAPGRTPCATERDPVLAGKRGRTMPLRPAFSGDGRRATARCPSCGAETGQRVCPHCHSLLPNDLGLIDSRLIALVGAKQSGKTVLTTVLIHELFTRVGDRFGFSMNTFSNPGDKEERYERDYESVIYGTDASTLFDQTPTAQAQPVDPLVYRVIVPRQRRLRRDRVAYLSFFDTAGEDLRSQASVEVHARYLAAADGIILLLDPLQEPGGRMMARPGVPLPRIEDRPGSVLDRILVLLRSRLGPNEKVRIPVAVAFSKLDAFRHLFGEGHPLRRPEPGGRCYDDSDGLDVHAAVRGLLQGWDGGHLDRSLSNNFVAFRYFGLSALGEAPTSANTVPPLGVAPYRVADPLLWLFHRFDLIPGCRP